MSEEPPLSNIAKHKAFQWIHDTDDFDILHNAITAIRIPWIRKQIRQGNYIRLPDKLIPTSLNITLPAAVYRVSDTRFKKVAVVAATRAAENPLTPLVACLPGYENPPPHWADPENHDEQEQTPSALGSPTAPE